MLFVFLLLCGPAHAQRFQQQDGLFYEVPDSADLQNQNFFNLDNRIYTPGKEFIYAYTLVKNDSALRVGTNARNDTKTKEWIFTSEANSDSLTIHYMGIKVLSGYGGLDQLFPDYSQTVIEQRYYSADTTLLFEGSTGLIENSNNVWLHPFRGKYFSVTEFSPFPYIKLPLKAGTSWTWKLNDISERWSDPRIVSYQGKQSAEYGYRIIGNKKIKTAMGKLRCHITLATAITSLGISTLVSYFHPQYGFVQLSYVNIDGTQIQLALVGVRNYR